MTGFDAVRLASLSQPPRISNTLIEAFDADSGVCEKIFVQESPSWSWRRLLPFFWDYAVSQRLVQVQSQIGAVTPMRCCLVLPALKAGSLEDKRLREGSFVDLSSSW